MTNKCINLLSLVLFCLHLLFISYFIKVFFSCPKNIKLIKVYFWKLGELQEKPSDRSTCSLSYYEGYNKNFII